MGDVRFIFLESFYGGSHRDFADGLVSHSRHEIVLATLPARFWKWRMRGAALHFSRAIEHPREYDGVIATDLMSISDLKALWGSRCPPVLAYFHENQLSYPLPAGEKMDYQFGFTDITSCLAADRILFNSHFHMNSFFEGLGPFIRMMPEYRPVWAQDVIRAKSGVLYPGCDFPDKAVSADAGYGSTGEDVPLIIWNHRWEFDKQPEIFFSVLDEVASRGCSFRLALLGENFQKKPKPFIEAREKYQDNLVHYGYAEDKEEYRSWLSRGAIVISTAGQENFGISVIEAIRFGCFPLLPRRLSYPEIIPERFHSECLYAGFEDLVEKLDACLSGSTPPRLPDLQIFVDRYSWKKQIDYYDKALEEMVQAGRGN